MCRMPGIALSRRFSTPITLRPFYTVPHAVVTPTRKLFSLLLKLPAPTPCMALKGIASDKCREHSRAHEDACVQHPAHSKNSVHTRDGNSGSGDREWGVGRAHSPTSPVSHVKDNSSVAVLTCLHSCLILNPPSLPLRT